MSSAEIDEYLADLEEPKRSTLQRLRQTILEVVPEAEEGISYRHPAFRLEGKVIAGFGAFKNHLSYLLLPATLSAHGAAAFVGDGSATLHGDGDRLSRITPAGPKAGCGVIVG